MDFYGMHFEYDGISSRLYDLVIASVNKSRDMSISGKANIVTMYNRRPVANHYLNTRWDKGNLSLDLEIVCDGTLSHADQRAVTKWLFHTPGYRRLYFEYLDDEQAEWFDMVDGGPVRYYLNCILTEPEKIEGNGGVCGYKCKAICDAPWAWSDEISVTIDNITEPVTASALREAGWVGYIDNENDVNLFVVLCSIVNQTEHINSVEGFYNNMATYGTASHVSIAVMTPVQRDSGGRIVDILTPSELGDYALDVIGGGDDTLGLLLYDTIFDDQTTAPDVVTAVITAYRCAEYFETSDTLYIEDRDINIYVDSDANEYIYPVVTVVTTGEDFNLWNSTDDVSRITGFAGVNNDEEIIIDGQINYVKSAVPNRYDNFISPNFLRLLDGDNEVHVQGNVKSVQIAWKNRRYI